MPRPTNLEGELGEKIPKPKERPLTSRQGAFVAYYTDASNPKTYKNSTRSAEAAGYPHAHVQGAKCLGSVRVRAAVDKVLADQRNTAVVTSAGVLKGIEEIRNASMARGNYAVALRAEELRGKTLAMFTDRVEQVMTIEEVNTDDLRGLIAELSDKLGPEDEEVRLAIRAKMLGEEAAEPAEEPGLH